MLSVPTKGRSPHPLPEERDPMSHDWGSTSAAGAMEGLSPTEEWLLQGCQPRWALCTLCWHFEATSGHCWPSFCKEPRNFRTSPGGGWLRSLLWRLHAWVSFCFLANVRMLSQAPVNMASWTECGAVSVTLEGGSFEGTWGKVEPTN